MNGCSNVHTASSWVSLSWPLLPGRYVETLGEPTFKMPKSSADQKAEKEKRKREKEAVKEKARRAAAEAAAADEANKGESPAEKKTRIAREEKVKQMLFNLDQQEGNRFFMASYRRLAVRAPHFCRYCVRVPTTHLAPQILDVIVMFIYLVYLVFVYPAREPTFAKNGTAELIAPVRSPVCCMEPAHFHRCVPFLAGASMVPFHGCDFRVACCDRKFAQFGVTPDCACCYWVQGGQVSCAASYRKGDDVHALHWGVDQLPVHHLRHHQGCRCD